MAQWRVVTSRRRSLDLHPVSTHRNVFIETQTRVTLVQGLSCTPVRFRCTFSGRPSRGRTSGPNADVREVHDAVPQEELHEDLHGRPLYPEVQEEVVLQVPPDPRPVSPLTSPGRRPWSSIVTDDGGVRAEGPVGR